MPPNLFSRYGIHNLSIIEESQMWPGRFIVLLPELCLLDSLRPGLLGADHASSLLLCRYLPRYTTLGEVQIEYLLKTPNLTR